MADDIDIANELADLHLEAAVRRAIDTAMQETSHDNQ